MGEEITHTHTHRHTHTDTHTQGILYSHEKGNLVICHNMHGPWAYALYSISQTEKQMYCRFYVDSKEVRLKTRA